ncbi:ribonuclease Z [bacterium]|nr:ribonuclease Z [bacterium]
MEIIFLGTSAGTPTKTRNLTAIAIKKRNYKWWYLVDCGEGTQHQLLKTGLSLLWLKSIFITHVHGDHFYGLAGLLATLSTLGRKDPLKIVSPVGVRVFLETIFNISQEPAFPIEFIDPEEITNTSDDDFDISWIPLEHRIACYGFIFKEHVIAHRLNIAKLKEYGVPSGPLWGKLQKGEYITLDSGEVLNPHDFFMEGDKARVVAIAGDNSKPELFEPYSKELSLLVHEATYTEEAAQKIHEETGHSSALKVAQFAEANGLKNLILTHFSPRYRDDSESTPSIKDIEDEAKASYNGTLSLAKDFNIYTLNRDEQLSCVEPQLSSN